MALLRRRRFRLRPARGAEDIATIESDQGEVLLSCRQSGQGARTFSILVGWVVSLSGAAAALFLLGEKLPFESVAVLLLTAAFTLLIGRLTPPRLIALERSGRPPILLASRRGAPLSMSLRLEPGGLEIAELRRALLSFLGRNRWRIVTCDGRRGFVVEEGLPAALVRKLLGSFRRNFQTDLRIVLDGRPAGRIVRRLPDPRRRIVLEIDPDVIDARIAIAATVLLVGREP